MPGTLEPEHDARAVILTAGVGSMLRRQMPRSHNSMQHRAEKAGLREATVASFHVKFAHIAWGWISGYVEAEHGGVETEPSQVALRLASEGCEDFLQPRSIDNMNRYLRKTVESFSRCINRIPVHMLCRYIRHKCRRLTRARMVTTRLSPCNCVPEKHTHTHGRPLRRTEQLHAFVNEEVAG